MDYCCYQVLYLVQAPIFLKEENAGEMSNSSNNVEYKPLGVDAGFNTESICKSSPKYLSKKILIGYKHSFFTAEAVNLS